MDVTNRMAEYIVNTTYDDLPVEVVEKTKRHILDTVGVMLPAFRFESGCRKLAEIALDSGGAEESTLLGTGGKVPATMAAFANASLCHPMDYDDTVDEFPGHPSAHTFPAAFAAAEKAGNISGRELIATVALCMDMNVRLTAACTGRSGEAYPWFNATVFGVFSATAAAGKLLGLTAAQMVNAFGIALDRAGGITESFNSPDSEVRAIRDGFGNREGVLAAIMAQKGIEACKNAFDILYKVYYNNAYDPAALVMDLGQAFFGLKVGFKPWPCCRVAHTHIKAALDMCTEYDIHPDAVDALTLTVGKFGRDFLFTPLEVKQRPQSGIQAKLSLPFIMGIVFTKRRVIIEDFLDENLSDENVLQIAEKTDFKFDPDLCSDAIGAGIVEVRLKDGSSMIKREDIAYGNPAHPLSDDELIAKFRECARYAPKPMDEKTVEGIMDKILRLEDLKNIEEISELLS